MKKFSLFLIGVFAMMTLLFNGCTDSEETKNDDSPEYFILCEGNFQQSNASLWGINEDLDSLSGPIYWDSENPLGDVGQSLAVKDGRLFIVMNNSHSLEIMDASLDDSLVFETSLEFAGLSPRYIAFGDNNAFVSAWGINGIAVIDLQTYEITDTISVNGLPEDLIYKDGKLFVALNMNSFWGAENKVLEISLNSTPTITDTFEVVNGPEKLLLDGDDLFVTGIHYDVSWNSIVGISKINLTDKTVVNNEHGVGSSASDIIKIDGNFYQSFNGKILHLNMDLTLESSNEFGDYSNIYSMWSDGEYVFIGQSDYIAPDTVVVINSNGEMENTFTVGALPGAYCKK